MWNTVGAVLAGVFFGSLVNMALILLNTFVLFPVPEGIDFADPAQMSAYVQDAPVAALLVVILAHLAQAFVGGWIAARLDEDPVRAAMIVGALSAAGGVLNLVNLSAPLWMAVELPLYFLFARLAAGIEQRRRA